VSTGIAPLSEAEVPLAVALWQAVGLTRPWNDPEADARRALSAPDATVLALRDDGQIVATAMVGFDGHRAWVYYLATAPGRQRQGLGRAMMRAAEDWALERGAPKIELMVRETNDAAAGFYEALGYGLEPVKVFSRWLNHQTMPASVR
jgi:ribosomal protein S18 acetylase RimI-like enzyme